MSIDPNEKHKSLTVKFEDIMGMNQKAQREVLKKPAFKDMLSQLSPAKRIELFPGYYRQTLDADQQSILSGRSSGGWGSSLIGAANRANAGGFGAKTGSMIDGPSASVAIPKSEWEKALERAGVRKSMDERSSGSIGSVSGNNSNNAYWTPERQKFAINYLMEKGNISRAGATSAVARWRWEAPKGPSDSNNIGGGHWGIVQWGSTRVKVLEANGHNIRGEGSTITNQLDAFIWEGNNVDYEKPRFKALQEAETLVDGARAMADIERAGGYNGNGDDLLRKQTEVTANQIWNAQTMSNPVEGKSFEEWKRQNPDGTKEQYETAVALENEKTDRAITASIALKNELTEMGLDADLVAKAGDITLNGTPEEFKVFAEKNDLEKKVASAIQSKQSASASPSVVNDIGYSAPVTGMMLHEGHGRTSEFGYARGRLHAGIDTYSTDPETGKLRVGNDAPVTAPADGKVSLIRTNRGEAGNYISFRDSNGIEHRFLHTAATPAINPETEKPWKVGDNIKQGQTLTYITGSGTDFYKKVQELDGNMQAAVEYFDKTGWGNTNKPHAHYEVRRPDGKEFDPGELIPQYSGNHKDNMVFSNENDLRKYQNSNNQFAQSIAPSAPTPVATTEAPTPVATTEAPTHVTTTEAPATPKQGPTEPKEIEDASLQQPLPTVLTAAKGADFVTDRATPIVAGEAGKEHVQITPLEGPNRPRATTSNDTGPLAREAPVPQPEAQSEQEQQASAKPEPVQMAMASPQGRSEPGLRGSDIPNPGSNMTGSVMNHYAETLWPLKEHSAITNQLPIAGIA